MIVSFDVPNAVATELNAFAVTAGYANAKAMTVAYWKATLLGARDKALRDSVQPANTDDVVVS